MKKNNHFVGTEMNRRSVLHTAAKTLASVLFLAILFSFSAFHVRAAQTTEKEIRTCLQTKGIISRSVESLLSSKGSSAAKKLRSSNVKLSKTEYTYNGHFRKPSANVMYGGKKLKQNRDYTVSYKNHKRRGTGKVIIRGKGSYYGTVTKKFKIK